MCKIISTYLCYLASIKGNSLGILNFCIWMRPCVDDGTPNVTKDGCKYNLAYTLFVEWLVRTLLKPLKH